MWCNFGEIGFGISNRGFCRGESLSRVWTTAGLFIEMAAYISDNNILFFIIGVVSGGKGWMFRKVIGGGRIGGEFWS